MRDTQIKKDPKPFTVSFHAAADARLEPEEDVLEERLLHKAFLLTHIPASWPSWKLAAGLVLVAFVVWLVWWPLSSMAVIAAGIYLGFALADWLLLWWLVHSGRSFGPVGPLLFVKTIPRVGAVVLSALAAWVSGSAVTGISMLIVLQLLGTLAYLWGTLREPFALATTYQVIKSGGLSPDASPIRLLHLSDLHVERLTHREARLLELIEQAQPEIIVITGDYLNLSYVNDPTARAEVRKVLARLQAPYGVYATLGSPPVDPRDTTPSLFDGLNIRLLRDEVAVLTFPDGRTLSLLGLDCEHDLQSDLSAFQKLIGLAPPNSVRVLLYHSPELMPFVQQHSVDLYLCGHTHGGQVRMPFYGAILTSTITGKRYEMGAYTEQNTTLYVSRGIGLEGLSAPRMRLFCPPEIILFSLAAKTE